MRIAICFSGAIRSFHTCIPSIMRYLIEPMKDNDKNQVDIFLHMWDVNSSEIKNLNIDFKMRGSHYNKFEFMHILKPKKYSVVEFNSDTEKIPIKNIKMNDAKFSDNNYSSNAIGMYYKIYEANNLKKMYERENNFKYDFCWRARLDYIFEDSITMDMLDFLKDNDKLYLIKDRYATGSHKKTNDKFWGGSNYIIDKMCDIYKDIPKYYKQGINIEGQTLTETQIKNNNFNVKMISNQDCYYKCQGRHEIKFKGITIKLHNLPFKLNFELAYLLLYDGYKVIGPYHKILNCFEHYKNYGEGTRIIITTEPRREDFTNGYKKRFLIGKSIINKYVTLQFKNINEINLAKFILSLIKYQSTIEYFNFESEKRIKLEVNDEVTYRIPDRGYVAAKIININDQVIKFKKCSVLRDNVFSTNKVKHYKEGILPID